MQPAELMRNVRRIEIKSRRVADAMAVGSYRSAFRGSGVEFEETREYAPGDEVKSIDWKVTARMGRPYVKVYREERELSVTLAVDVSASGLFGTRGAAMREMAVELGAILAVSALKNGDKAGLLLFSDKVERYIPPRRGAGHVWRLIREMLECEPGQKGTDIGAAARFLSRVERKRGVTAFLSDFLDTDYLADLRRLSRRRDVIAAVLGGPDEMALPEAGILRARDLETGRTMYFDCSDRRSREAYAAARRLERGETLAGFAKAGIDCLELSGQGSAAGALRAFFAKRGRRRGGR